MTNEFTIFDFNAHNFYSTAWGAHSNLSVLLSFYFTATIKSRKKKKKTKTRRIIYG